MSENPSQSHPTFSVVVPLHNEEATVDALIIRLKAVLDQLDGLSEIIFVNDGSTDGTLTRLRDCLKQDKRFRLINFSRNFGHQRAITAGIDHASGAACVVMDGDLQDPPELILAMAAKWKEGFDVVYAVRTERRGETLFKTLSARGFYRLLSAITDVPIAVDTGDFRLMDRKVVDALGRIRERGRFIRGLVNWVGYRQTPIYYVREARKAGETHFSFRKMLRFSLDAITAFSILPLQFASTLGLIVFGGSFIYALDVLYDHFVAGRTIAGWTSLMIVVLFFGSVQLLLLGVLGEYLGRVFEEVKQRPLYLIQSLEGFENSSSDLR